MRRLLILWAVFSGVYLWTPFAQAQGPQNKPAGQIQPNNPSPPNQMAPEKLVVLTFDDGAKSHFTNARPILKRYGFGATFFVTEGFDFPTNKKDYMTWEEIAQLHRDGFEIGNHTRDHLAITAQNAAQLKEQLQAINDRCRQHGIPQPTSFAWPGNVFALEALPILAERGIRFARRGGGPEHPRKEGKGFAYQPRLDHPLLIPSAGNARPGWKLKNFVEAVSQAQRGRVAVLQFHGVPDTAHAWVSLEKSRFEQFMKYLADNQYKVIALRDLEKYVDPRIAPHNPREVIEDRKKLLAKGRAGDNSRKVSSDKELKRWLTNMAVYHRFNLVEISAAMGLSTSEVDAALKRLEIKTKDGKIAAPPARKAHDPLVVLPYPGGRHPRIGFLDGAIRPQRETKLSVFAPWRGGGYVVVDVPEAIWWTRTGLGADGRELLYLAHTHVPTHWSKRDIDLQPLEWTTRPDGVLEMRRRLPNKVEFGAKAWPLAPQGARPHRRGVRLELWITNGSKQTLGGLRVQNCVMLAAAPGFEALSTENKVIRHPYIACKDKSSGRWIITAWENCIRPWANKDCPCMHSDPQFPDCPPGQTKRLQGWLSFYEGQDLESELKRIETVRKAK